MLLRLFCLFLFPVVSSSVCAQENSVVVEDLEEDLMVFDGEKYERLNDRHSRIKAVYFSLSPPFHSGEHLRLHSSRKYYLFINGKIKGEYQGEVVLAMDSLAAWAGPAPAYRVALYQEPINVRDLGVQVISHKASPQQQGIDTAAKPYSHFRDFSVMAALLLIIFFVVSLRLNPKLAADYFSVAHLLSSRETDDAQASARLTSSANVQFWVLCSLLIGYYLLMVMYNLPPRFALPLHFQAPGFGFIWLQWLKLTAIIFGILLLKLLIIVSLTRLFGMRGMARYHFFNWIRLLLLVFTLATFVLFMYFIARGSDAGFFVAFLSVIIVALVLWIMVAFFKLSGRSGHSMFHLFSYLCATELIPLLITVKVLFQ